MVYHCIVRSRHRSIVHTQSQLFRNPRLLHARAHALVVLVAALGVKTGGLKGRWGACVISAECETASTDRRDDIKFGPRSGVTPARKYNAVWCATAREVSDNRQKDLVVCARVGNAPYHPGKVGNLSWKKKVGAPYLTSELAGELGLGSLSKD